jgi:Rhodopirellula transposase DDE domain
MSTASNRQDKGLLRKVLGTLNEAQRRWLVGREALRRGRGGIQRMLEESGLSKPTIRKGIGELRGNGNLAAEQGRVRKCGRGRKPIEEGDPDFPRRLEPVMDESTVGDPLSPLQWSRKSTYQIRQSRASPGPAVSQDTIQRRLRNLDDSLSANRKDQQGDPTPTGTGRLAT